MSGDGGDLAGGGLGELALRLDLRWIALGLERVTYQRRTGADDVMMI